MHSPGINVSVVNDLRARLPHSDTFHVSDGADIPLSEYVHWMEAVVTQAGQAGLAWHLGQCCDYSSRGVLGEVVMHAGSLGAGLHWLCKFYPLIQDATSLKLEVHNEVATLSYRIMDPNIWPRHQDALYSLGVFAGLIRVAEPESWSKVRILLEASQRDLQPDLRKILHAPVSYDAMTNAIAFPASALEKPLKRNNELINQQIQYLSQLMARKHRAMPVTERARYIILADLSDADVCQEHVARELGLSSRTLRRKLSTEGVSYQELLDECRMQVAAREFSTARNVSLSQVALKLGYSEHSTFTRAFHRWSGVAPRTYRGAMSTGRA